jgi:DNA-binding LacI/PurR family transcriptional regulator
LIDTCHEALDAFSCFKIDDVAGGRAATQHLIELGHERIGFVGDIVDTPFHFVSSRDRHVGYQKALQAADLPLRPEYCMEGAHGRSQARALAREMLSLSEPPTAIFAASDTQAVGVLEAARELGLHVPKELSVIGYDDIEIADIMELTTMRQRLFESGRRGAESLLATLHDPDAVPVRQVLSAELVERSSTASPSSSRRPSVPRSSI